MQLRDFPTDVGATADLLDQCASQTRDLLNAVGGAQTESDIVGLENQANQVFQVCTKAQAGADQLVTYLRAQARSEQSSHPAIAGHWRSPRCWPASCCSAPVSPTRR